MDERIALIPHICPVCSSLKAEFIRHFHGRHSIFTDLSLVRCGACHLVYANPLPNKYDLDGYNSSYFHLAHGGQSNNKIDLAFFSGVARLRASFIRSYLRRKRINIFDLLEIGPGAGFFAKNWLSFSPKTRYFAIESDKSCYGALEGIGVKILDFKNPNFGKDRVDLIVMSHVLEHVSDPFNFLSEMTQGLCSGGALFIEVPCQDWVHKSEDEPHLLFFEKTSMEHLLKRLGFVDIEMGYFGLEIDKLKNKSFLKKTLGRIRNKLIALGLIAPFSRASQGLEDLHVPLERAAVAPYCAHIESTEPAWWLRVIARKS